MAPFAYVSIFVSIIFCVTCKQIQHPVILVPGDGGSQIQAKINESVVPHDICYQHTKDFFELWLNFEEVFPYVIECFVHNMKLQYNNISRTTCNQPGVQTRVNGWGNTTTVDYLDATHWASTKYFITIILALEKRGYKRGLSVRGAPYDFRKAPNEMSDLFKRFKLLIEDTYERNGKKSCILIGHSMGNPVTLYFLNRMPQTWKDQYIHAFVSLASPWGGAVKPLRLMASGDSLGEEFIRALTVRAEQRSMPSTAWLLPSKEFWSPGEALVVAPHRNYTVNDYRQFFNDVNFDVGFEMWRDTEALIAPLRPPNVTVHCMHGVNVSTPGMLVYDTASWYDSQPRVVPDNGDGTVNIRSLRACMGWRKSQTQEVYHAEFNGVSHMDLLADKAAIKYILKVVFD